jgi:3-oxosteroid 1-dehydrogenase
VTDWPSEWNAVSDVVVVGAGAAGYAAAITSAAQGRSVLLLERGEVPGGTTAKSAGTMWIPNNPIMRLQGIDDDRDAAIRYMARVAHPDTYSSAEMFLGLRRDQYRLLEMLYDQGATAFSYLAGLGAVPYDPDTITLYPDYHAELDEDEAPVGRSVRVRLPADYNPEIHGTGGQILIDAMRKTAARLGVDERCKVRVIQVLRNDADEVVGVEARSGRETLIVGARRGVIFATGGFLHDRTLADDFLAGHVYGGAAADTSVGDFVRIGMQIGAQLSNMRHAWWDQVALEDALRVRSTIRDCFSPFGESMIMVNKYGRRVMNEKLPYSVRGPVHFAWDPSRCEHPNRVLLMIFDDKVLQDPRTLRMRYPVPLPDGDRGHVISGSTLRLLAQRVGERLAKLSAETGGFALADSFATELERTVIRFNEMARAGLDADFGRGQSAIEVAWAAAAPNASALPNPTMTPFSEQGPYHCILLGAGALDTKGGPVADDLGHVAGVGGDPIPGLYGAGNCVASPAGQGYFGPGGTIGPALTQGYVAGLTASSAGTRTPAGI